MTTFKQCSKTELLGHALNLGEHAAQWREIKINIFPELISNDAANALIGRMQAKLPLLQALYHVESPKSITMLCQIGSAFDPKILEHSLSHAIEEYKFKAHGLPKNDKGLKRIEINLLKESEFSRMRKNRAEKVFMVIDDDAFLRGLINSALRPFGTVIQCHDGQNVLDLYKKESPDFVLLDIHLPGESGKDILKKILALDPQATIIMISSDSVRENVLDTMGQGASWFISKPFTKERILESVRKCGVFENT